MSIDKIKKNSTWFLNYFLYTGRKSLLSLKLLCYEKKWIKTGYGKPAFLRETGHPENFVAVKVFPNVIHFTTVRGYVYLVEDKKGDGANVTFHGPVNALLTQSLMPRMTYIRKTLVGMCSDMSDYVSIAEFMAKREERHNGEPNPQDKHGWRVNMKFDNELVPWLPAFEGEMRSKRQKKQRTGRFARK